VSADTSKAKVSVTLASDTLAAIDHAVAETRFPSRSAAIETLLRAWVRGERRRQRDAEIDAYYDSLTEEEQEDERDWAELGYLTFARDTAPEVRSRRKRGRAAESRPSRRETDR